MHESPARKPDCLGDTIFAYIFIYGIVNNSFKYLTANWREDFYFAISFKSWYYIFFSPVI